MSDLQAKFAPEVNFPFGIVFPYAGRVRDSDKAVLARQGWYLCDGEPLSRDLPGFDVVGTLYGTGDDVNTFNAPDYRGRFLRGVDNPTGGNAAGLDPDASERSGFNGGAEKDEVGSLQDDVLGNHTHSAKMEIGAEPRPPAGAAQANEAAGASGQAGHNYQSNGLLIPTGGHETRPKNVYINYIIFLGR